MSANLFCNSRMVIALVLSLGIHLLFLGILPFQPEGGYVHAARQQEVLSVFIAPVQMRMGYSESLATEPDKLPYRHMPLKRLKVPKSQPAALDHGSIVPTPPTDIYFSTAELSRKALPVGNIDTSAFKDVFISGLPVKLRIFINASGRVAKIEALQVSEHDIPFMERLEQLLSDATFLPAKKDGLDVNSFQDIEFGITALGS